MTIRSIYGELERAAETGYREIVSIRVTPLAIQGSLLAVLVSPERARVLGKLRMLEGQGVVADPAWCEEHEELLIHPRDWMDLLSDQTVFRYISMGTEAWNVFGIPVLRG